MSPRIVFDVNQAGYQSIWFPAIGLVFFAVGATLAVINRARRRRGLEAVGNNAGGPAPYLPRLFMAFSIIWMIWAFIDTYSDYRHLRDALNGGRCQVIEGRIEHYHAGSGNRGDADDSFDLNGFHFSYSSSTMSAGFNQSQTQDGPLHEGLHVRIHAYDGEIARLEILP